MFNDVRGQCLQVQELCRGSVQALREGLLSLEERMAAVRKEVCVDGRNCSLKVKLLIIGFRHFLMRTLAQTAQ